MLCGYAQWSQYPFLAHVFFWKLLLLDSRLSKKNFLWTTLINVIQPFNRVISQSRRVNGSRLGPSWVVAHPDLQFWPHRWLQWWHSKGEVCVLWHHIQAAPTEYVIEFSLLIFYRARSWDWVLHPALSRVVRLLGVPILFASYTQFDESNQNNNLYIQNIVLPRTAGVVALSRLFSWTELLIISFVIGMTWFPVAVQSIVILFDSFIVSFYDHLCARGVGFSAFDDNWFSVWKVGLFLPSFFSTFDRKATFADFIGMAE